MTMSKEAETAPQGTAFADDGLNLVWHSSSVMA
jgi:hypothetical protein